MNKTIFLVEDDSAIVDIYKALMNKFKFTLRVFNLGKEAIKVIKEIKSAKSEEKKPDIVLLDLILPDINGLEVLKAIRHNEATKGVKVFILTNQSDVKFDESDEILADKVIIKAEIAPTNLMEMIKKELGD